ncbi:MAG: sulfite exporter TauE/SafE family protein [Treponema sp.]|jgi:sulfite exporter TauE/SafE/copper chaperone CopZ/plastocyanin domain-containing protein|nr:sulfite exporter TauE/SafE family protein [Treponema sp.]
MVKGDGYMKTAALRIGGMSCINCQDRIEKKLKSTVGVEDVQVSYRKSTAELRYNASVTSLAEIVRAVEELGYQVLEDGRGSPARAAGTLILILALYVLVRHFGSSGLAAFPLAEAGMGYGMLFVIGLVTSVHCLVMCGGINLSQCISAPVPAEPASPVSASASAPGKKYSVLFPSILYNGGRVISYTFVGAAAGALGSVLTVSGRFQGVVQLAAGVFMVVMGINMLGFFPALRRFLPRMPKRFARKIDKQKTSAKNPLVIGLLNGLMPCGPLQAMQLYALSTGSPIAGAVSMLLFGAGTVPLMFGAGALSSFLSNAGGRVFTARVMKAGAVLVSVLGLVMFSNGWSLAGFTVTFLNPASLFSPAAANRRNVSQVQEAPLIENGVQIINSTLSGGRYPAITVEQGVPVKWIITAPQGSINGCNNRMIIREYGIEHHFKTGENIIEFTPQAAGKFSYSCWMGMIRSSITVVTPGVIEAPASGLDPEPAGVAIATDRIVLAQIAGDFQTVKITLRDDGIDPAIIVVQKNLPVVWTITNDSLDPGNSGILFPSYYFRVAVEPGDNIIRFMPLDDFDFSTKDNVFYGFVKTVDNLDKVDIEAVKAEASNHETFIYPDAYFEKAAYTGDSNRCCAAS